MTNQPLTESEAWALIDQVRAGKTLQVLSLIKTNEWIDAYTLYDVVTALTLALQGLSQVRIKPEPQGDES